MKFQIAGTTIEIKEPSPGEFAIYGLSVDEDRHHWVYSRDQLQELIRQLTAFTDGVKVTSKKPIDKKDPTTWEIKVY